MSAGVKSSGVQKIAVLRANALGDYIFTLPALDALKHACPEAELVYLGCEWHRDFLSRRPGPVDRVVVVPACDGVPREDVRAAKPHVVDAFFHEMQAERFDIALQMHGGGGNSNPFVRRLGAQLAVGLQADGAPPLDINVPYALYHNEVLRYLEVAAAAGAPPVGLAPRLCVTAADRHALARELPEHGAFVVLHPGATDVRRRWPAQKMAGVADHLAALGYAVCVTGVPEETDIADAVVAHARSKPRNLCGRLSLPAFTALLERASLVIANDTGPLHLARAVGTPTIGVYWIGNVISGGPVTAQHHRIVAAWTMQCPACGMDCIANDAHVAMDGCAHDVSFVAAASENEVIAHAESLLEDVQAPERHHRAAGVNPAAPFAL